MSEHKNNNDILLQWLGKKIKFLRNTRGISQEELADIVGVHRTYIGMVERGEKNATILTLSKFVSALDITLSDLLEGAKTNGQ
jgi:transcriptional regulator with XRE-family HTH domain